jgi:DMSO/TMAO reductase YedYZ molybdopterin-dependent catalytic subunit
MPPPTPTPAPSPAPAESPNSEVPAVEIRQYQGENLSSINDFRENSIKGPQHVDISTYALSIHGLVDNDLSYTYDAILASFEPHKKVITLSCVEGWDVTLLWEGVLLSDLFKDAGVSPEASTVIFRSVDGYSTSLPLDFVMAHDIMLAYKMNDLTLPPERGYPFELVAESKWGYKWIKWVNDIELSNNQSFEGYWEKRGYSNSGDLNKPFFG